MKKLDYSLAVAFVSALLTVIAPGCGGGGGSSPPEGGSQADTPVADTRAPGAEGTAAIKGTITLLGDPPEMPELVGIDGKPECADLHDTPPVAEVIVTGPDGALANTFVYISQGISGRYNAPDEAVIFDQQKCVYTPHVIGIQVGQLLQVNNGDPFLHNVHVLGSKALRETNKSQPKESPPIELTFNRPHIGVSVKCDVHPWMQAYACVVDHPFFAVSGADGSFELPARLPAGTYTVTAWHEKLGTVEQEVTIGDGETQEIGFEFEV